LIIRDAYLQDPSQAAMEEASVETAITRAASAAFFWVSGAVSGQMVITMFVFAVYDAGAETREDA